MGSCGLGIDIWTTMSLGEEDTFGKDLALVCNVGFATIDNQNLPNQ